MTQRALQCAVAARTGESIRTIVRRGFNYYVPTPPECDEDTADVAGHPLLPSAHERTHRPGT